MKKIIVFVIVSLFSLSVFSDTYMSIQSGNWNNYAIWNLNTVPSGTKQDTIIISSGTIVTANNLTFDKSTTIIIQDGAELIINTLDINIDATETKKDFSLIVQDDGKLTINGNFTSGKDAMLNIDGSVVVNGNVTLGQNATIVVDSSNTTGGELIINGNLTAGIGSQLLGYGPVTVYGTVTGINDGITSQLPIDLILFNVKVEANHIIIIWSTATEINNDYFEIQYSVDAINWKNLIKIDGNGNTSILTNYSYAINYNNFIGDENHILYFRLKQDDFDGKFKTFEPKSIHINNISSDNLYEVYNINGNYIQKTKYSKFIDSNLKGVFILKNDYTTIKIIK